LADTYDVAIVGGGPAGQAAALKLAPFGLRIAVIDEQPRPGGQIARQPPRGFAVPHWLSGRAYAPLRAQLARFEAADGIDWLGGRSVIGLAGLPDGPADITLASAGGVETLRARRVLVAAGCHDLAVPLPGWTLPGVYATGGLQAFVKSQQVLPGGRILFAGTHPLQLLVAAQVVAVGGNVAAVCFAQGWRQMAGVMTAHAAPAIRNSATLLPALAALTALRRAGVPVRFGAPLRAIHGDGCVTGAQCGDAHIDCDTVGLCYGFVPQSALVRMAGAGVRAAGPAGGWAATHDRWMRSSLPWLFVAGETTGVAGWPAAMAGGEIAGIGIAHDLGLVDSAAAERDSATARSRHDRHRRFAALLDRVADPRPFFPALDGDTLVCRCEDVPLARIAPLLAAGSANSIKLATRCGMGQCQGRNCEPTLLRLLGAPDDPGFAARFPSRPVRIGDLA
jgi:thioredoxin reductase